MESERILKFLVIIVITIISFVIVHFVLGGFGFWKATGSEFGPAFNDIGNGALVFGSYFFGTSLVFGSIDRIGKFIVKRREQKEKP